MVEAVAEDHLTIGRENTLSKYGSIMTLCGVRCDIGHFGAFDVLRRQHTCCRPIVNDAGKGNQGITLKIRGDILNVAGFHTEIEFIENHSAYLREVGIEPSYARHETHETKNTFDSS